MKALFLIVTFFIIAAGCKKYPEDESFIHLKRPEKRLSKYSHWQIIEYTVNGVDSIPYIDSKVYKDFALSNITWQLSSGGFAINEIRANVAVAKFEDHKKKISIGYAPMTTGYTYPIFLEGTNIWGIKQLDKKDFIIETNKNGKNYRIHFHALH